MPTARILIASIHTFIAAVLAAGGVLLLVQTQVNATWEKGFYGELSVLTAAILLTSGLLLGVAALQTSASLAFALGYRAGTWGLVIVSVVLAAALPPPISWLMALGAVSMLLELWAQRLKEQLPPED
jgi:uncharacterized transporter YbjL